MKITLAVLLSGFLLTLAGPALYAAPPTEFLEIPWGATAVEIKRKMAQRPGVLLKEEATNNLRFGGGAFANYSAVGFDLELPDGKFSRGTVHLSIPPGKDRDGIPLRNVQFEKLLKTLSSKYGKGKRSGDGNHSECNWKWTTTDPRTGNKRTTAIRLSYSWKPYDFIVTYSNLPTVEKTPNPATPTPTPLLKGSTTNDL